MGTLSYYFAIGQDDRAWGMHVLDCGSSMIRRGSTFPEDGHPVSYQLDWQRGRVLQEYQLFYLYRGSGTFESRESGVVRLDEGSVVLIHPNVWHRYHPVPHSDWYTYWIGFDGAFARHMAENMPMTISNPVSRIGYHEKLVNIFMEILQTGQTEFTGYQQVLAGELFRLFGWLRTIHRQREIRSGDVSAMVQQAKTIMIRDKSHVRAEVVAEELNIGYSKFRKHFKAATGMAPGQYSMQIRLRQAQDLLTEGSMSVKEVAGVLGFESPQYFSRIFKQKTGRTPGSYRRQSDRHTQ